MCRSLRRDARKSELAAELMDIMERIGINNLLAWSDTRAGTEGWTVFHCATATGQLAVLERLFDARESLKEDERIVREEPDSESLPSLLLLAAWHGQAEVLRLLFDRGLAFPGSEDAVRALPAAARRGKFEACVAMVECGVDPGKGPRWRRMASHEAHVGGFPALAKWLERAIVDVGKALEQARQWRDTLLEKRKKRRRLRRERGRKAPH